MRPENMIWQSGTVRRDDAGETWLEFADPGACSRCSNGTGCGAALFSRLFSRPATRLKLDRGAQYHSGQRVRAGLDARWLVRAAVVMYLVPVVAFVGGAAGADRLWPDSDALALASGLGAALVAVLGARYPARLVSRPPLSLVDVSHSLESGPKRKHFQYNDE